MTQPFGDGNTMELVRIPSGKFISSSETITIEQPFWMARNEVTNRQFAEFAHQNVHRNWHNGSHHSALHVKQEFRSLGGILEMKLLLVQCRASVPGG